MNNINTIQSLVKKNVVAFLVMIFLVSFLLVLTSERVFADEVYANGTCGNNLTWTLSENGILTISGTGEMSDLGLVICLHGLIIIS